MSREKKILAWESSLIERKCERDRIVVYNLSGELKAECKESYVSGAEGS